MSLANLIYMQTPRICREPSAPCFSRDVRTEKMLRPWAHWVKENWFDKLCGVAGLTLLFSLFFMRG